MIVLVDVALVLGVGGGYLWWAREVRALRQELVEARRGADARPGGPRAWTLRGIVRSVIPSQGAIFLTHEAVPGLMPGMTMVFEVEDPKILDGLRPGDPVQFTLQQTGERLRVTAIDKN